MKYVSIDIETTGLSPKTAQVLEFAAIIDNSLERGVRTPPEQLPSFRAILKRDTYKTDAFCASLHNQLWKELNACPVISPDAYFTSEVYKLHKINIACTPGMLGPCFREWLRNQGTEMSRDGKRPKIRVAGKNFASFDLPFLLADEINLDMAIDIQHRVIDVSPFFWQPGDTSLPDTETCLKRSGIASPSLLHTAIADAMNVIHLVRHCMLQPYENSLTGKV